VKQKAQASAAFLGVSGFSRHLVNECCIGNTFLTDLTALEGNPQGEFLPLSATNSPNQNSVEVPTKRAAALTAALQSVVPGKVVGLAIALV
jgi:hypothetical protein